MIKFLNWLVGLRPTPCMKMVPVEPDPPGPASLLPKPQPSGGRLFIGGIEQPQPTGSETLLEMVGHAIAEEPWEDEAKGAVLAVARWLRTQGAYTAVALLEREAGE